MLSIEPAFFLKGALIFIRVGAIVFSLPFFGDSTVPLRVRLMLSIAISLGIYPIIPVDWQPAFTEDMFIYTTMIIKELVVGLVIGYVAKFFFEGIIMASSIVGYQMGFGTANLMLPGSDAQLSAFTAFHRIIVLLIFLSLSLHHIFIKAIVDTFILIPAGSIKANAELANLVITLTADIFSVALRLAAPILVALLFTMAALGLIARTVPQLNVFTMSFPMSFFIGLSIYIAITPFLTDWLKEYFEKAAEYLFHSIQYLAP